MREKKETKTKKTATKKVSVKEPKVAEKVVAKKEVPKKEKGVLNPKEKKYYKVLSRIVQIFSKIARIFLMICVPFLFLIMILIPFLFKNFEVNANIIKFGDINIIVRDENISVKVGEEVHVIDSDPQDMKQIVSLLTDNSKTSIIVIAELTLLVCGIVTVMEIYLLSFVEKLFGNFYKEDTPFTSENTRYILLAGIILAAIKFIDMFMGITDLVKVGSCSIGIIEILGVFVIYFIFKYATGMQGKVDTKITD